MAIKMSDDTFDHEIELTNGVRINLSIVDNEEVQVWIKSASAPEAEGKLTYEDYISEVLP